MGVSVSRHVLRQCLCVSCLVSVSALPASPSVSADFENNCLCLGLISDADVLVSVSAEAVSDPTLSKIQQSDSGEVMAHHSMSFKFTWNISKLVFTNITKHHTQIHLYKCTQFCLNSCLNIVIHVFQGLLFDSQLNCS